MKVSVNDVLTGKDFPAISIVIPTHPGYPDYKLDREHMNGIISSLEKRLESQYSKNHSKKMIQKLKEVVQQVDFSKLSEGLAVYVSPHYDKIIHLPFHVSSEKVIVDENFEVRDIIQAVKSCRDCLVVVLSQNKVKTFTIVDCQMNQVVFADMPEGVRDVTNEHSLPGWDYFDTKSWEEKNIHNYIHFIDSSIEKELKISNLNVIILGDKKLLGLYRKVTRLGEKVIGYAEGNYEHANHADLKNIVRPLTDLANKKEEEYALKLLAEAIDKDNYASGIAQVWRSAIEGRGRLLLVEKDYRQTARRGTDKFTISLTEEAGSQWGVIADAVDDVIQAVLMNKGDVIFMENGTLGEYQRIVLINRY